MHEYGGALDVGGDDRVGLVLEDSGERPGGRRPVRSVDLLQRYLAFQRDDDVRQRSGRHRGAHGDSVELALQLREHEADRLRGAGRRRNEVDRGGARPTEVLVRHVEDDLIVRVRVDGGHEAGLDRREIVDHHGQRRDAVRRARGVRDDVMLTLVVALVVDAEHDRVVGIGGGSGDDHLARTRVEVLLRSLTGREEPGRLEDDIDAELTPRQCCRIALREHLHLLAAGVDNAVPERHLSRERAEHRVVLEEMRHRRGVAEVVDRDDLDVGPELLLGPEEIPPDASETVDADANRHDSSLSSKRSSVYAESIPAARVDPPVNPPLRPPAGLRNRPSVFILGHGGSALPVGESRPRSPSSPERARWGRRSSSELLPQARRLEGSQRGSWRGFSGERAYR